MPAQGFTRTGRERRLATHLTNVQTTASTRTTACASRSLAHQSFLCTRSAQVLRAASLNVWPSHSPFLTGCCCLFFTPSVGPLVSFVWAAGGSGKCSTSQLRFTGTVSTSLHLHHQKCSVPSLDTCEIVIVSVSQALQAHRLQWCRVFFQLSTQPPSVLLFQLWSPYQHPLHPA